jgi:hypothetical protein
MDQQKIFNMLPLSDELRKKVYEAILNASQPLVQDRVDNSETPNSVDRSDPCQPHMPILQTQTPH